jgi:hypothetical protein
MGANEPGSGLPDATCADCIAFDLQPGEGRRGLCRFRTELGLIPETLLACAELRVRKGREGKVRGVAVARPVRSAARRESERSRRPTLKKRVEGDTSGEITMDRDGLKQVLRELLEEETLYGYPEMGRRWEGGTMVLRPADEGIQCKELPLDTLFHKVVMLRDRLRVLEARINGHEKLSEQDKLELQGYISKCYGTLTTFNQLFADKADHFVSK